MIPQIYHGTAPPSTHRMIAEYSILHDGICLNVYDGYENIAPSFKRIEGLGVKLFLDNGSFERYGECLAGKITDAEYNSPSAVTAYFKRITKEYEACLAASVAPANLIMTVPEVIGNTEATSEMQARFLPEYMAFAKDSGVSLIMALQFAPKALDWDAQARAAARGIAAQDPGRVARVGIPFGKDYGRHQTPKGFPVIEALFARGGTLAGREAHMFGLGSPMKHQKYAKGKSWIASTDAATLNRVSNYASYISRSGFILDIRDLKGERGKESEEAALAVMKADGILGLREWRGLSMAERYRINLENYDHVIQHIYSGAARPRQKADLLSFAERLPVKTMAVPVARQEARPSGITRLSDRPDAYFKSWPDGLVVNFVAFRRRLAKARLHVSNITEAYHPLEYAFAFDVDPGKGNRVEAVVDDITRWIQLSRIRPPSDIVVRFAPPSSVSIRIRGGIGWFHDVETLDDMWW